MPECAIIIVAGVSRHHRFQDQNLNEVEEEEEEQERMVVAVVVSSTRAMLRRMPVVHLDNERASQPETAV